MRHQVNMVRLVRVRPLLNMELPLEVLGDSDLLQDSMVRQVPGDLKVDMEAQRRPASVIVSPPRVDVPHLLTAPQPLPEASSPQV